MKVSAILRKRLTLHNRWVKLKTELMEIERSFCKCVDCQKHCGSYMLKDPIWDLAVPEYVEFKAKMEKWSCGSSDMANLFRVCIKCVEKRLGRKLEACDFLNVPINDVILHVMGK